MSDVWLGDGFCDDTDARVHYGADFNCIGRLFDDGDCKGDSNGDGLIRPTDVESLALNSLAGVAETLLEDLNCDGVVDVTDAVSIARSALDGVSWAPDECALYSTAKVVLEVPGSER